ncbi:hypothetical protein HETIRDRAFT_454290 [Heterobasidion irregulare TC 32-1]|uniref:SET domain-containing protein n=1 Tax=Heterobasidion irregulare (strain TC 32-1) TaxID=747525 RepID=W4JZN8_HETIT|nr:uncharacterized protein HETIRDRAFT_454290 [Heterobasidion irregulare TC 32-1]ETW78301.1 hypothetical protein HETIRDRAFT_454290 [Heterobasidion irregulare TC 32-1]
MRVLSSGARLRCVLLSFSSLSSSTMRRGFLLAPNARKDAPRPPASAKKPVDAVKVQRVKDATPLPIPSGLPRPRAPSMSLKEAKADAFARLLAAPNHAMVVTVLPPPPTTFVWPPTACATCLLYPGVKERILATPSFPTPFAPVGAFNITDVPDAGKGVVLARAHAAGALIAKERPLPVLPEMMPYDQRAGGLHPDAMLAMVVENHTNATDRAFLKRLTNYKSANPADLRGIVETNALLIGTLPGSGDLAYAGVCDMTSRFNHSCSPNAHCFWDLDSFSLEVRAPQPIPAGAQATITYLSTTLLPRRARQHELRDKYAFTCARATCALPTPDAVRRSDARRGVLASLCAPGFDGDGDADGGAQEGELRAWAADAPVARGVRLAAMLDAETRDADAAWCAVLQGLVRACCALRDAAGARACPIRAVVLSRAFTGAGGGRKREGV